MQLDLGNDFPADEGMTAPGTPPATGCAIRQDQQAGVVISADVQLTSQKRAPTICRVQFVR
jgi:hypothetical protein